MGKLIERIKEVFTGKFVYKPKKKEGAAQSKGEKQEEKPKEQK